jgi:hypothetical protein
MDFRRRSRQIQAMALAMAALAAFATVRAQSSGGPSNPGTPTLGILCIPSGSGGCYSCNGNPSPGTVPAGCTNTDLAGYTPGACGDGKKSDSCSSTTLDCGANNTCATPPVYIGACTTLALCVSGNGGMNNP